MIWDVASMKQIGEPLRGTWDVEFSPNGEILATAGLQKIYFWNTSTWEPIGEPLIGHKDIVFSISFSPDGRFLASSGDDGTVRLWDVYSGQQIGVPIADETASPISLSFSSKTYNGHRGYVRSVDFSPINNSLILASGGNDASIRLWDINIHSWIEKACQRAGRNLNKTEWRLYFPGEEYRITCPHWPSGE
jgi:WD40 repeat protein